jgi:hypothetical protein
MIENFYNLLIEEDLLSLKSLLEELDPEELEEILLLSKGNAVALKEYFEQNDYIDFELFDSIAIGIEENLDILKAILKEIF